MFFSAVKTPQSPLTTSLPGLIEHLPLSELPGAKAGGDQEDQHTGDHKVLEVVLDQVEALARRDPGAVQVESVDKHKDGGLQARGRCCDTSHPHHSLIKES